jgi:hypothetical protein
MICHQNSIHQLSFFSSCFSNLLNTKKIIIAASAIETSPNSNIPNPCSIVIIYGGGPEGPAT